MQTYVDFIKDYFKAYFPGFELITEFSHGPHWGVRFSKGDIEVNITGDIGFEIQIVIGNSTYDLWQYDRSVNDGHENNPREHKAPTTSIGRIYKGTN